MSNPLEKVEADIFRHEDEIKDINRQIREITKSHTDLSKSYMELGLLLKTVMEKFPTFEKKLDLVGDKLQLLLIPNKQEWDMEKRLELLEKSYSFFFKFNIFVALALVVLVILNPEVAPFILGVLQNKVP